MDCTFYETTSQESLTQPQSSVGRVFFSAHPDDWLLFMFDSFLLSLAQPGITLLIIVSDGGKNNSSYALARQIATLSALSSLSPQLTHSQTHPFNVYQALDLTVAFLNLPDGGGEGNGFPPHYQSLTKCLNGSLLSSHTWTSLVAFISAFVSSILPDGLVELHTHSPHENDHPDHVSVGYLSHGVRQHLSHLSSITHYQGYSVSNLAPNAESIPSLKQLFLWSLYCNSLSDQGFESPDNGWHRSFLSRQYISLHQDSSPLAIVMCLWRRPENLPVILSYLSSQHNTDFELFLWNNNPEHSRYYAHVLSLSRHFPIHIHNSPTNQGGIGRFILTNEIHRQFPYVVYLDDDQRPLINLTQQCRAIFKPRTITSWWGHRIVGNNYFDRYRVTNGSQTDYCGTGGCLLDSYLFSDISVIKEIPYEYRFVEDLWMSFFARFAKNYTLRGQSLPIEWISGNEPEPSSFPIDLTLLKTQFLQYLRSHYASHHDAIS